MPLPGFVAPVTLVGSVVQHAAETLSGVALSQLAAAGGPHALGRLARGLRHPLRDHPHGRHRDDDARLRQRRGGQAPRDPHPGLHRPVRLQAASTPRRGWRRAWGRSSPGSPGSTACRARGCSTSRAASPWRSSSSTTRSARMVARLRRGHRAPGRLPLAPPLRGAPERRTPPDRRPHPAPPPRGDPPPRSHHRAGLPRTVARGGGDDPRRPGRGRGGAAHRRVDAVAPLRRPDAGPFGREWARPQPAAGMRRAAAGGGMNRITPFALEDARPPARGGARGPAASRLSTRSPIGSGTCWRTPTRSSTPWPSRGRSSASSRGRSSRRPSTGFDGPGRGDRHRSGLSPRGGLRPLRRHPRHAPGRPHPRDVRHQRPRPRLDARRGGLLRSGSALGPAGRPIRRRASGAGARGAAGPPLQPRLLRLDGARGSRSCSPASTPGRSG